MSTFDEKDKKIKGEIGLNIHYLGIENVDHLEILNEARLSALAISIYLAAIVTNPIVQKTNYKIIFLDDIFVGLDMSNRLPLLEILQKFWQDGEIGTVAPPLVVYADLLATADERNLTTITIRNQTASRDITVSTAKRRQVTTRMTRNLSRTRSQSRAMTKTMRS